VFPNPLRYPPQATHGDAASFLTEQGADIEVKGDSIPLVFCNTRVRRQSAFTHIFATAKTRVGQPFTVLLKAEAAEKAGELLSRRF